MDNPIPAAPSDMAAERWDKWKLLASSILWRGSVYSKLLGDGDCGLRGGVEPVMSEDSELVCIIPRISGGKVEPGLDESRASGPSRFCRSERAALYGEKRPFSEVPEKADGLVWSLRSGSG